MRNKRAKTIMTTALLFMAVVQEPLLYCYLHGFLMLCGMLYMLTGLLLTVALFNKLLTDWASTTAYHVVGLILIVAIGLPKGWQENATEYLEWKIRLAERQQIVNDVKSRILKPGTDGTCTVSYQGMLPIAFPHNVITVSNNANGSTTVEFGIDGLLDHHSSFYYTDDKAWVEGMKAKKFTLWYKGVVLKLDDYLHVERF